MNQTFRDGSSWQISREYNLIAFGVGGAERSRSEWTARAENNKLTDLPDGQISFASTCNCGVSSPNSKNILLPDSRKSSLQAARPDPLEGRCATSSTRVGMRWTRMVLLTRAPDADGEVVWS